MMPTSLQLRTLRLLAAGVKLEPPERRGGRYRLTLNGTLAGQVLEKTVHALCASKYIILALDGRSFELTATGRARAEVNTFVRAFAEEQQA